jgi:DNA polymerase-3 subunit gamma/tau
MYAASQAGHHKVYIVDEAHMLTREAWNALLKILEEPPPDVVFVFATTEPQKIAATAAPVLSRLQRFDFRRIALASIRERLRQVVEAEGIAADDDALTLIARHADGGMRDALSVLDQCLSFGEGAVSAARVREVLGLVGDELYAELLALVADRRPEGVFPLIDRLVEAGADLAEFMGAAGEVLRSLLMLRLGHEPEGLTEAVRQSLELYRERLEPGDVVRMLRLLTESEISIRRSASPRLVVETLLLRWAMMDRTVDLREVLEGGRADRRTGGPGGQRGPGSPAGSASAPANVPTGRVLRDSAPPVVTPSPVPADPLARAPVRPSPLAGAWPEILAEVRSRSRFLGEALAGTAPGAVEGGTLALVLSESNPLFAERIQAQAGVVEEVLQRHTGQLLRIRVTVAEGEEASVKARPITESSLRADRLRSFRAKDPALDTAADAVDLEIVD